MMRNPYTSRQLKWVAGLLALSVVAGACGDDDGAASDTPTGGDQPAAEGEFVIGYAAAQTGELAPYDSPEGVECRVQQLNEQGGINGQQIRLIVRDSRSDPATSATVGQELLDAGADVLLGPPTDDTLIPIAGLAAPQGVPVLSVGSTQGQFPLAAPENGFLVAYADNASAAAAAEHALSEGAETAYLLFSPDIGSYSQETPRYFAEAFERGGGRIIGEDNYSAGLSDYSPQITRIRGLAEQPDVIFVAMLVPDIGVFVRQLAAAGLEIPVYGTDGFDDPALIEVGGEAAGLAVFVTHGFPEEGSRLAEFYDDCTERGFQVQNIFFGLGGEAVEIVKAAAEAAGSLEPEAINSAIREIEGLEGITTDSITYRDRGGVPLKRMAIVTVENGEFVQVGSVLPEFVPDL